MITLGNLLLKSRILSNPCEFNVIKQDMNNETPSHRNFFFLCIHIAPIAIFLSIHATYHSMYLKFKILVQIKKKYEKKERNNKKWNV